MRSTFIRSAIVLVTVTLGGAVLLADVRTEQKTHATFGGPLGRMIGMFGGKAAKEGIVETVAVKGDRKMTTSDKTARLIDLAEEKIYEIDLDGKSYKVTTFAEIRKKMQEDQEKAKEQMAKMQEKKDEPKPSEPQKKMAIDVSTKETGQKKTINGFDCKEVITTIAMHEDGRTLEEAGGMVMTNDSWMTAPIPAMKEVQAFDRRYFEKISGMDAAAAAQQMAQALAMYPGLKDLMGRARMEGTKVDGTRNLDRDDDRRRRQSRAAEAAGRQRQATGVRRRPERHAGPQDDEEEAGRRRRHRERRQEPLDDHDDHDRRAERGDHRRRRRGQCSGGIQGEVKT